MRHRLGQGLSAYRGHNRRVRLLQGGLYACINITASAMYDEGPLVRLIHDRLGPRSPQRPIGRQDIRMLQQFLKRLRVQGLFGSNRIKPILRLVHITLTNPGQFPGIVKLLHNPDSKKKSMKMISELESMVDSRLKIWFERNNGLPQMLIMYRDGVSDGQLQQSLDQELPLLMNACTRVYSLKKQPLPNIIWQACQKRYIVRFYGRRGDTSGAFDPVGNPLPGLIVDNTVVTKNRYDWYATSHKCLQGTSVPGHHDLLFSDLKIDVDALQHFTFAISYIFGRSVTSIGIPAPARLADRLCDRVKHRLHDVHIPQQEGMVYDSTKHFRGQDNVHPRIRDTMYYV